MKNTTKNTAQNAASLKKHTIFNEQRAIKARARKKMNEMWKNIASCKRYRTAASIEASRIVTDKIMQEVQKGVLLNLNERHQSKSTTAQLRILRRIVEKRQAQATHDKCGRSDNLSTSRLISRNTHASMVALRKKRQAA